MNQEQVIEWAREAGTWEYAATREEKVAQYMRFAALVAADAAAKERNMCALMCDGAGIGMLDLYRGEVQQVAATLCANLAAAIRARGNKEGV